MAVESLEERTLLKAATQVIKDIFPEPGNEERWDRRTIPDKSLFDRQNHFQPEIVVFRGTRRDDDWTQDTSES